MAVYSGRINDPSAILGSGKPDGQTIHGNDIAGGLVVEGCASPEKTTKSHSSALLTRDQMAVSLPPVREPDFLPLRASVSVPSTLRLNKGGRRVMTMSHTGN